MRLIIDGVTLERGSTEIIAGISAIVEAGTALILTGPNGAGKSTLLRALAGFLPPALGSIRIEGGDADDSIGEQAHFIGHLNAIKPGLTVAENLRFWGEYLGSPRHSTEPSPRSLPHVVADHAGHDAGPDLRFAIAVANALAAFELMDLADIPAAYLSAGQKRRLALARLLVAERPIWLLDEPTTALDAASVARVTSIANAHLAAGGLIVAATHLPLGLMPARELRLGAGASEAAA